MNMLLHGVENPDIRYRDSLAQADQLDEEKYSLVLANPPFAGSLDYESTAKDLLHGERPVPDARGHIPGAPIGNANARKHGRYSAQAIAERRQVAALIRAIRGLVEEIDGQD